jgi:hypothetical protein
LAEGGEGVLDLVWRSAKGHESVPKCMKPLKT